MSRLTFSAQTALVLIFSASTALAVTPEEVWTAWQAQVTQSGGSISAASQSRNGDVLELSGVKSEASAPEITFQTEIDKVLLKDLGNGAVEILVPNAFAFSLSKPGEATPIVVAQLDQSNGSTTASGDLNALNFDFAYPQVTAVLTELYDHGEKIEDASGNLNLRDLKGRYVYSTASDGKTPFDYAYDLGEATLTAKGSRNNNGESFAISAQLAGASSTAKGVLLAPELMEDLLKAVAAGFSVDGTTSTGAFSLDAEIVESGVARKIAFSNEGGKGLFALTADRLDYGFDLSATKFTVTSDDGSMPPVDGSLEAMSTAVSAPMRQDGESDDFSFLMKFTQLQVSDGVWNLFDPGAQLARDPANFVVDLAGKGAWLNDFMDSANSPMAAPTGPMRIDRLDVKQILLQIIGGEVDGNGALTFDNENLQSWGGFPAPDGKLVFNLKGINALIDKAVAMGFVSENDLMGVRMGLAMFTRPGSGPDSLVSEIEFKDNGLFVNGQRLQ